MPASGFTRSARPRLATGAGTGIKTGGEQEMGELSELGRSVVERIAERR